MISMGATAAAVTVNRMQKRDQGRVLLIADDPAMAAFGEALERAGFAVVGVVAGAAALVSLRRTRPHVVIANANLKGIKAEELARLLAHAQDGLPLVVVGTEAATLERRSAALATGAFDYFQLPTELALLITRTTQLVSLRLTIDRLRAEADRDYLTGLANRRRFRIALGHEVERWRRYKMSCALLLVDIDHMKRINDTYGHPAGDVAIRHIASVLVELSRDNDTPARLGGEEFALLLSGVNEAKAVIAAERVRQSVCEKPVENVGTVTVSIGVATCPAHANSERSLYTASDAALYRAKHEGRNRTAVAPLANN